MKKIIEKFEELERIVNMGIDDGVFDFTKTSFNKTHTNIKLDYVIFNIIKSDTELLKLCIYKLGDDEYKVGIKNPGLTRIIMTNIENKINVVNMLNDIINEYQKVYDERMLKKLKNTMLNIKKFGFQ